MLNGISPTQTAHPGTPLQLLILAIIRLFNINHSKTDITNEAFLHPEFYLNLTFVTLTILTAATFILLGHFIYKKTNDLSAALLIQLPALSLLTIQSFDSSFAVTPIVSNVSPEPFLISSINLFNLFFLKLYFAQTPKDQWKASVFLAIVCGFGLAIKLVFLPLCLAGLLIVSWRIKPIFIAISLLSFVVWTIPIIAQYPKLFDWIISLITHSGHYGLGQQEMINWTEFWSHLTAIVLHFKFLIFFTFGIFSWCLIRIKNQWKNRNVQMLLTLCLVSLLQILITAKHFSFHYLLPSLLLLGPILLLFYLQLTPHSVLMKRITLIVIVLISIQSSFQAYSYYHQVKEFTHDLDQIRGKIHTQYPNCSILPSATTATNIYLTQSHGLFLGNYGTLHKADQAIYALYPKTFYFNSEQTEPRPENYDDGYGIRNFKGQRIYADDLLNAGSCSIFLKLNSDFSQYPFIVKPIEESKYAQAYLLVNSTEKQAENFFLGALNQLKQGNYQQAFALALKARELNFQPRGKVEYYLGLIYPHIQKE